MFLLTPFLFWQDIEAVACCGICTSVLLWPAYNCHALTHDEFHLPTAQHRILLIDDHLLFAEGLKAQLVTITSGDCISILNDGSQFIRQLAHTEDYDLYIFDMSMPNVDGIVLVRKLIEHNPQARILIISATNDRRLADEILALGAKGFVTKAASPKIMLDGVRALLGGRQYLDPCLNTLAEYQTPDLPAGPGIPPRTREVLKHMANGHTNKSIADLLSITEATVKWHISRLFELLEVNNRTACVAKAARLGLVDID